MPDSRPALAESLLQDEQPCRGRKLLAIFSFLIGVSIVVCICVVLCSRGAGGQHLAVIEPNITMASLFQPRSSSFRRFQPLGAAADRFQPVWLKNPIAQRTKKKQLSPSVVLPSTSRLSNLPKATAVERETEQGVSVLKSDVVIIGSGIAGLSCGAILASLGYQVTVLESHSEVGGAAHTWERKGFHFESGPSLYTGFSGKESSNPLKNVMQIIGEEPEWLTYDGWGAYLPEGDFTKKPEEFDKFVAKYGGPGAEEQWNRMMTYAKPLGTATQSLTSLALREDLGAAVTLGKYPMQLLNIMSKGKDFNEPFGKILDKLEIDNKLIRNWLDMLCFLLQGCPASGSLNAMVTYMLTDCYKPGVPLDFPKGGSGGIVAALRRGIEKNNGRVITSAHVEEILVEDNKAVGVKVRGKKEMKVYASKAVVSNADPAISLGLLEAQLAKHTPGAAGVKKAEEAAEYLKGLMNDYEDCGSFIHLHAGIDGTGLPTKSSEEFPAQWAVVNDWNKEGGVEAPRNLVLVSMPSLIDSSLAPEGKHIIHAYTPATEPYADWAGMDRKSEEYKRKKAEAEDFLWKQVERVVPKARERAEISMVGTPLTHQRFLRRKSGTYGPRVEAGKQSLPGHKTPLNDFYLCGDFTYPGIGLPATASSGAITANSIVTVPEHLSLLDKIRLPKT